MAKPPAIRSDRPVDLFKRQLTLAMPTLKHMVPQHVSPEKFQAMVVTAVAYDKNLLECSTESLIRETAQAAELGLSLNKSLREADILTVFTGGTKQAQMRPRYMGLMKLARQSGEIADIYAHAVREGDDFDYELGLNKRLHHKPGGEGEITHAYVVWTLKDGTKAFEVLTRKRLDAIRDRSEGYKAFKAGKIKSTPWESDHEEMCRKTAVRAGSKYMPISNEKWAAALAADNRGDAEDVAEFDAQFTDVTESAPAEKPATTDAGAAQADRLADKVTPAAKPTKEYPPVDVPEGFDGPDYEQWRADVVERTATIPVGKRKEWLALHESILAAAPKEVADAVRALGA